MLSISRLAGHLRQLNPVSGGVYTAPDLAVILEQPHPSRLTEVIRRLVREGVLRRLRRGLYVDQLYGYRPDIAGCRWVAPSYLSTETALDRQGLCQTGILAFTYVTTRLLGRRERAVRFTDGHRFVYRHVARHLFFGYRPEAGVLVADPEKAALDFLYFLYKRQFSVIAPQDIDFHKLHAARYRRYVKAYRQPGFPNFAMQWLAKRRDAA